MPLPQQVIERLGKEPPKTPGWSSGLLLFSIGVFAISGLVYLGLAFGYGPYLDSQIATLNTQITALAKSISPDDQTRVTTFYSQVTNIKTALQNHVVVSRLLSWLEKNTETNVYYTNFSLSAGGQVMLSGVAKSEADVNQQIAIFEGAPEVEKAAVSSVLFVDSTGLWQFSAALTMDPAAVLRAPQSL